MSRFLEKRQQAGFEDYENRAIPRGEDFKGMLQACEDQTSDFDWGAILRAVAATLGLRLTSYNHPLPSIIFEGFLTVLPSVQHFPEDNFISIKTGKGVCPIVVWAHHILGLTVLVRNHDITSESHARDVKFGSASQEHVVIDFSMNFSASAFPCTIHPPETFLLQSCSTYETVLQLKPEEDLHPIDATCREPLKGYGDRVFQNLCYDDNCGTRRLVDELRCLATARAITISKHLCPTYDLVRANYTNKSDLTDGDEQIDATLPDYYITSTHHCLEPRVAWVAKGRIGARLPNRHIQNASGVIFDNVLFDGSVVEKYVSHYKESIPDEENAPEDISILLKELARSQPEDKLTPIWELLMDAAETLAVVILALAYVVHATEAAEMPVRGLTTYPLATCSFRTKLYQWDGQSDLEINEDVWLEVLALLLVGRDGVPLDLSRVCLLSKCGWSIFASTFGESDPSEVGKYAISCSFNVGYIC